MTRKRTARNPNPIVVSLPISTIRLDFQPPENIIEETVQTYIEQLQAGKQFPPLTVCFDGENHFLKDGFHRLEAARRAGLRRIQAEIFPGTLAEMEAEFSASGLADAPH